MEVKIPDHRKANGLTRFIVNYLTYMGHRATRINTVGRLIKAKSGKAVMIHGTTRRGTADISSTIQGRSVMWEVKVGKDKPSEHQLAEQERERSAGGEYLFVHAAEEFFAMYDELVRDRKKIDDWLAK